MKINKNFIFGILAVGLISGVLGYWLISFTGMTGLVITSDEPITFTSDLEMSACNVLNSACEDNQTITILNNEDTARTLILTYELNFTDTNFTDNCIPQVEDYEVLFYYNGDELFNEDEFDALVSSSNLTIVNKAVKNSCESNLSTSVIITAQE